MKPILHILTLWLFIVSCSRDHFHRSDLPGNELIDSLIYCIVDSFDLTHDKGINKTKWTYAIVDSLGYLNIARLSQFDSLPSIGNYFFLDFLKSDKLYINGHSVFSETDSDFILYQFAIKKRYDLNKELFPKIRFVSDNDIRKETKHFIQSDLEPDSVFRWIRFYTPLVSFDKKHAIIQMNVNSVDKSLDYGELLILEKKNRWTIIKVIRLYQT